VIAKETVALNATVPELV